MQRTEPRDEINLIEYHVKYLLSLLLSSCPSKEVKLYLKPLVNFFVDHKVLVTDLLGCEAFF